MTNYIPFLKTKVNEFAAIKKLDSRIAENITPFFDINRKAEKKSSPVQQNSSFSNYTEVEYKELIKKLVNKFKLNTREIPLFYLDDYDIDNDLFVNGEQSYGFVIKQFQFFPFIPVIGIDRTSERNGIVFSNKNIIQSDTVAIRIIGDDLQTGLFDFKNLAKKAKEYFSHIELIIDLKILPEDVSLSDYFAKISKFLHKVEGFSKVIISGSSIPKSIGELVSTNKIKDITRKELELFTMLNASYPNLIYGDYTIVSPYYSDVDMPAEMLLNITAAKVIYSYGKVHHVYRGETLKSGNYQQFKDFCEDISSQGFFRGKEYSYGDDFIYNAMNRDGNITQSSILAPTINAHISYMYKDYQL